MPIGNNMKRKKLIPEEDIAPQEEVQVEEVASTTNIEEVLNEEVETSLKFIVEPSRRKSVKKAKIFIEGELTIYNAKLLQTKILEALESFDLIDFKLRAIKDIDLSAIQVLFYTKELYKESDKTPTFQLEELPMELKSLLVKTKYNKILFKKQVNPTS